PQVKLAWPDTFGNLEHVQQATEGVGAAHDCEQYARPVVRVEEAIVPIDNLTDHPVHCGKDSCMEMGVSKVRSPFAPLTGKSIAQEQGRSYLEVLAFTETITQRSDNTANREKDGQCHVDGSK